MLTNGCTYGAQLACGKHGTRSEVTAYQRPGSVVVRRKAMDEKNGPRGVWVRGASWRKPQATHKTRQNAALDACASRKITYDMATVAVRKHR